MNGPTLHAALDDDMALGFSIAGVKDIYIISERDDPKGLRDWFTSRLEDREGIIVLSAAAASTLKDEIFAKRAKGSLLPVVVVLPGSGEDQIARDLIRRAIGMMPHEEGSA